MKELLVVWEISLPIHTTIYLSRPTWDSYYCIGSLTENLVQLYQHILMFNMSIMGISYSSTQYDDNCDKSTSYNFYYQTQLYDEWITMGTVININLSL